MMLRNPDDIDGITEPETTPPNQSLLNRVNATGRNHPVPICLCLIAPIVWLFGASELAIGLYAGAGLYCLSLLIDQLTDDLIGEGE